VKTVELNALTTGISFAN